MIAQWVIEGKGMCTLSTVSELRVGEGIEGQDGEEV